MIVLRWAPYPEADVASYKLCRSIVGFSGLIPANLLDLDGKILELKFNGGPLQQIAFNGTDPVIDQINAVIHGNGGDAYNSIIDTENFIVRSTIREAPGLVEIVGGSAMPVLGLTARIIAEKSEDELIAEIPALPNPNDVVSFEDPDGVPEDYYRISTVSSINVESLKTDYKQAISFTGSICVIEGFVTDLQGVRMCGVEVKAKILQMPNTTIPSFISRDYVTSITGEDGRFSLPLLQGANVEFSIPELGYSKIICVPTKAFEFLKNIATDSNQY